MKTLIVGGGLSGLALADRLEAAGHDYMLLEARARFGGRILTEHSGAGYFDMGPAWFWPGQPRMAALTARLGLETFDQFTDGMQLFEDAHGQVRRGRGAASMEGSLRLTGGLAALIGALAARIPERRKRLNAAVSALARSNTGITATLDDGGKITAERVVLCLPPRVIAAQIAFTPSLPIAAQRALAGIPTWMAGQAKALAVYDKPFWRADGLSGDAHSRAGPMVELHDASPNKGGPTALFGFIGVPPMARRDAQALQAAVLGQLVRLFGPRAARPRALHVKDWAFDPLTATAADLAPMQHHPTYGLPDDLTGLWAGTLQFAGTEVAPRFGGFLEGALEAGEAALGTIA